MKKDYLITIERLHLIAGFALVISGILAYFSNGLETALSWIIFGAMYISMSDIGEDEMSVEKLNHPNHLIRRSFGYFGTIFSIVLALFYLNRILV
ncbi:hypothetical protein [Aureibacter tunicatorum]|uniref:Uncharacterized protein n=1 Tax=Aureibacter tunicatorum TaxID=866807 RepID=A0AAE3XL46_9BACT|nr:hypothetical protein [Aureibacter tunicatorum]MDR6238520.1 hypothetical protein [Aureibacter tunicatorum]BDD05547.1 hypothetical protein AUTU_30300 [Aureibacter tunicatorum]